MKDIKIASRGDIAACTNMHRIGVFARDLTTYSPALHDDVIWDDTGPVNGLPYLCTTCSTPIVPANMRVIPQDET